MPIKKLSELTTVIKIVGFTRAYPDTMRMRDFDGSIKTLTFGPEPESLTADLEIEVESSDGRKTTHQTDLPIAPELKCALVRILQWAIERHRNSPWPEEA